MTDLKLSVLDLLPLRRGQTSRQALLASKSLAQVADRLGYTRYWVAEHHNRDAIVATVPSVLIPFIAEGTTQIRLGAGGVMLANHAPFAVAEQFALLQEMFPGRIDLGLGRAPGTDQLTAALLRQLLPDDGVANYSRDVTFLRNLLGVGDTPLGRNHAVRIGEHDFQLHATPAMTTPTDMWLLGSSAHSAKIAARLGLPYAFANHFDAPNMDVTIRTYRKHYEASKAFPEPKTFVPVNVVVAESEEEGHATVDGRGYAELFVDNTRIHGASIGPRFAHRRHSRPRGFDAHLARSARWHRRNHDLSRRLGTRGR